MESYTPLLALFSFCISILAVYLTFTRPLLRITDDTIYLAATVLRGTTVVSINELDYVKIIKNKVFFGEIILFILHLKNNTRIVFSPRQECKETLKEVTQALSPYIKQYT